jgi:hypothetical protein
MRHLPFLLAASLIAVSPSSLFAQVPSTVTAPDVREQRAYTEGLKAYL